MPRRPAPPAPFPDDTFAAEGPPIALEAEEAKIAALAVPLITEFEGLKLEAYLDELAKPAVWTVGYGHTRTARPGMRITQDEAEDLLAHDLEWAIETAQKIGAQTPDKLNHAQLAALTSWIYNIGSTAALRSKSVTGRLRAGDYVGAANGLLLWNKAGGTVWRGLTRRREAERQLFLSEDVSAPEPEGIERAEPDNPEPSIGGSTTLPATGIGATGILVMIAEYVSGVTGLSPALQGYVLLAGAITGLGGLAWAGWERWRKHRVAEGW